MHNKAGFEKPLNALWWLKHRFFKAYMLREATVIPLLFFIGCMLAGIYSLLQGENQWLAWLGFMQQSWVVGLNILALLASLYHALTFFVLFPRVMPLSLGDYRIPAWAIVAGQWMAVVAVLLFFGWLFL
ncbi:fumarate reductase subunit C [Aliidiomarina minuta]|uniref:Fumarate reductase subunit C n=1 Tax=Aliidiomarina minuta TaxID=880057 RepID=A0A432W5Y2_9GAMM|nr:fumarate reductase subunit C [Aliidiomarina minuta]RUO25483.1 fumarate reductase subunit C [Aliidiomarina minuta]